MEVLIGKSSINGGCSNAPVDYWRIHCKKH
jgi:hypothetical protein